MNILIAYFSQTGNTEKIARAIYDEVLSRGNVAHLQRIGEITTEDFNDYDLVFLGSACHDTDLAQPVKEILDKIIQQPPFKLAGFVTHTAYSPDGGERQRMIYEEWAGRCIQSFETVCQEKGINWCGYFSCQGVPSPPIEEFIKREIVTDEDEWERYVADVRNRPNENDKNMAKEFARTVLNQFEGAAT